MSILIKNIEMPKSCWDCFACHDGWCIINQKIEGHRTVTHSCPLIEVPPHGRLIDADALKEKMKIVTRTAVQEIVEYDINAYKVDDAPTIIESEE